MKDERLGKKKVKEIGHENLSLFVANILSISNLRTYTTYLPQSITREYIVNRA